MWWLLLLPPLDIQITIYYNYWANNFTLPIFIESKIIYSIFYGFESETLAMYAPITLNTRAHKNPFFKSPFMLFVSGNKISKYHIPLEKF